MFFEGGVENPVILRVTRPSDSWAATAPPGISFKVKQMFKNHVFLRVFWASIIWQGSSVCSRITWPSDFLGHYCSSRALPHGQENDRKPYVFYCFLGFDHLGRVVDDRGRLS